jgi:aspartyl-tRNA(Asn)/glutamyl-tRNA(Gln) amidotransferase subunit B
VVNPKTREQYKVTIGIECHVQLKTKTKLFSAVDNNAREAEANTLISHIDLGLPGALPVLNEAAVKLATKAAFALGTRPAALSKFDRKHYFYPDLPMGYQITQFYEPIITSGEVSFTVDGQKKTVRIHEAHLEADAGKSTHPDGADYSLVDLNRAGTPLLEIVSEPDMHSSVEAKAYARELWLLMRNADVSDADLYQGNMRFDVNVSVSKSETLGTRTETKNLNSFKSVEKAIDFEVERQIELLEKGETVTQETRGWDEAKQKTFSQRSKEEAHDYRYMPDPDIPPVLLSDEYMNEVGDGFPPMPNEVRERLASLGIDQTAIETLLDELVAGRFVLAALDAGAAAEHAKKIANWLVSDVQALTVDGNLTWQTAKLDVTNFIQLAEMVQSNSVSSTGAKAILVEMVASGKSPDKLAEQLNVLQVSDTGEIDKIVAEVLAANTQAAQHVQAGEMKAIGFLVGQVMKASQGKANPSLAQELIKKQLGL